MTGDETTWSMMYSAASHDAAEGSTLTLDAETCIDVCKERAKASGKKIGIPKD